jgi:hypothetical protein
LIRFQSLAYRSEAISEITKANVFKILLGEIAPILTTCKKSDRGGERFDDAQPPALPPRRRDPYGASPSEQWVNDFQLQVAPRYRVSSD